MFVHATVAALPIAAFFSDINPILTGLAAMGSFVWFGILLYDRFKKDKK